MNCLYEYQALVSLEPNLAQSVFSHTLLCDRLNSSLLALLLKKSLISKSLKLSAERLALEIKTNNREREFAAVTNVLTQPVNHYGYAQLKSQVKFLSTQIDQLLEEVSDPLFSPHAYRDFVIVSRAFRTPSIVGYRVIDLRVGKHAVFVVPNGSGEVSREAFLESAKTWASLDHPAIPKILEVGTTVDGQCFFVLADLPKHTFRSKLEQLEGSSDFAEVFRSVLTWQVQIADAVEYGLRKGLYYLPVDPDSVLIGAFGEVILWDWFDCILFPQKCSRSEEYERVLFVTGDSLSWPPDRDDSGLGPLSIAFYMENASEKSLVGSIAALVENLQGFSTVADSWPRRWGQDGATLMKLALARSQEGRLSRLDTFRSDLERFLSGGLVSVHRYTWFERFGRYMARRSALFLGLFFAAFLLISVSLALTLLSFYQLKTSQEEVVSAIAEQRNKRISRFLECYRSATLLSKIDNDKERSRQLLLELNRLPGLDDSLRVLVGDLCYMLDERELGDRIFAQVFETKKNDKSILENLHILNARHARQPIETPSPYLQRLKKILRENDENPFYFYFQARDSKDPKEKIRQLKRALMACGQSHVLRLVCVELCADLLFAERQFSECEVLLTELLNSNPLQVRFHLLLAKVLRDTGQGERILAVLRAIEVLDRENREGCYLWAEHLFGKGDRSTALLYLERVLARFPKDLPCLRIRAQISYSNRNYFGALTDLRECLVQDPNDPLLRGVFIGCLARTHQWVELQTWREKWGEPKSVELKFYYAEVDFERGRAETALRLIGDVVQKRGEARDFALRGQIYWRKGQKDEALWDFDRALKKDPSLLSPAIVSGEHYLSEGLPDKALGIVNRSLVARGQIWGDLDVAGHET